MPDPSAPVDDPRSDDKPLRRIERQYHEKVLQILGPGRTGHMSLGKANQSPSDAKVIAHAIEILPHLGADVTAAYIGSAVAGESAQHEGPVAPSQD